MSLKMTATGVKSLGQGVWEFDMPPHQVRHFGSTPHAIGAKSVLMFRHCEYDASHHQLHFDLDDVDPINIGTGLQAVGISAVVAPPNVTQTSDHTPIKAPSLAPGDREFLALAQRELSDGMARTAEQLLHGVRAKSVGELKRGQSRNFSETPDNFWYVIVQPRVNELSVTVRGPVGHFEGLTSLEVKDDRGNTRFKVRDEEDVSEALVLIFSAIRKR